MGPSSPFPLLLLPLSSPSAMTHVSEATMSLRKLPKASYCLHHWRSLSDLLLACNPALFPIWKLHPVHVPPTCKATPVPAHRDSVLKVSLLHFSIQRPPTLHVLWDVHLLLETHLVASRSLLCLLPPPLVYNTALMTLENSGYSSVSPIQTVKVSEAKTMYFVCTPASGTMPSTQKSFRKLYITAIVRRRMSIQIATHIWTML